MKLTCLSLTLTLGVFAGLLQGQPLSGTAPRSGLFPADLFDESAPIRSLKIDVSRTNLVSLIRSHRVYVAVTIEEGGVLYTNVAMRLKGNEDGSYRPLYDKPAMTVNFDRFQEGQIFHGQDKVYLNNSVEDESYMNEFLGSALFRAAGVPAPRITWAMVEINGRSRGLYVVKEGFNKRFLRRYFRDPDGNLYDGAFVDDIDAGLKRSSGDGPDDNEDLNALAEAAREPDPDRRWSRLNELLDMERFLSFMAMEVLCGHWDGYTMNRNNYRVYHDPRRGLTFLPHGMDILFTDPDSPPAPFLDGLVSQGVIQSGPGSRAYHLRMSELMTNVFDAPALIERVSQLQARLRPLLMQHDSKEARKFDQAVQKLVRDINRRAGYVADWDWSVEPKPLAFDEEGVGFVTVWRARDEEGDDTLDRVVDESGVETLHISTGGGDEARPSWRGPAWLTPGRYAFKGRVRTGGVAAVPFRYGEGAGIRVAGVRARREGLAGDTGWEEMSYEFVVEDRFASKEVELVCELRASDGEAWFDLKSLRLVRF